MAAEGPSRRALLGSVGAGCAALLAGCTTSGPVNGEAAGPAPSPAGRSAVASSTPAAPGASSASAISAPADLLAATSQVPEGGGKIIGGGTNIVITQPRAGSFKAFTAVCTHEGCIVSTVSGGTINCPCHGSKYSIKDGSVVHGPAPSPLTPVAIKVEGTSIVRG